MSELFMQEPGLLVLLSSYRGVANGRDAWMDRTRFFSEFIGALIVL